MTNYSELRRRFAAFMALLTAACTGWRTDIPPGPVRSDGQFRNEKEAIKVILKDGRSFYMLDARLVKDSIVGNSRDHREGFARMAFAVGDVRAVETFGIHSGRTLLLALGAVAAVTILLATCEPI